MRPFATNGVGRAISLCLCICLLVTTLNPAKKDEPMPRIRWGFTLAPPGKYDESICAVAAMRSAAAITVAACYYASVRLIDGTGGIMFSGCASVRACVYVQCMFGRRHSHRLAVDFLFYRATLCKRGISHGCISVRLSTCPSVRIMPHRNA